jgi:hypothetical protein
VRQSAYKPGSGWHTSKPACVTAIPLGRRLPGASSNLPGRLVWTLTSKSSALSRRSLAPPLFGLAPGGVCHAAGVAAGAVRSYRTVSPLPRLVRNAPRRSVLCGTFPELAPAGRYPAPLVHGARTLPPRRFSAGAAVRPTDVAGNGDVGSRRQEVNSRARAAMFRGRPRCASKSANVLRVEASQMPSTRCGRKWRWKAVTTSWVTLSKMPLAAMP